MSTGVQQRTIYVAPSALRDLPTGYLGRCPRLLHSAPLVLIISALLDQLSRFLRLQLLQLRRTLGVVGIQSQRLFVIHYGKLLVTVVHVGFAQTVVSIK